MPPFHTLAKPSGAICNLDCSYCFYLSKERLYPDSRFRMSDEVMEAYVRQTLEAHAGREANLAWQGGEPTLMGLDFFRRMVATAARVAPPGTTVRHALQTNGILLDDDWCAFLKEHGFLVGLSVDGPAEIHDAYRVDRGGAGTHAKVVKALRRLQEHGVERNLLCTVHAGNQDRGAEVYRYFRDELGERFLQFIPIVERVGESGVSERSVTPDGWGRFLVAVFEEWVQRDVGEVYVQHFDEALAAWVGVPSGLCLFRDTCGDAVAVEHTGDVYSCDHFVDPDHRLGNLLETPLPELVASPRQRAFGQAKRDTLPRQCRECPVLFACRGECPKNRFRISRDGEPGLNYLCEGYYAFFRHVDPTMRQMAMLLAMRRPPALVMQMRRGSPTGGEGTSRR